MKIRKILAKAKLVDESVEFLASKTNAIYKKFQSIENCDTPNCKKEKKRLTQEMSSCLNKLALEERELDKCEEQFHAHSTSLPTPTPYTI